MKVSVIFAVQLSVLMTAIAAFAQDVPDCSRLDDNTFRLRADRFVMRDLPNFELKDWPKKPEIDAAIVNQIDAVKTAVPDWHGLHHMVPGTGSAKN